MKNRDETIGLFTRYFNALKSSDFNDNMFTPDVSLFTPFMESPVTGKDAAIGALKEISKDVADIKILRFVIEAEFACAIIEAKTKTASPWLCAALVKSQMTRLPNYIPT